MNAQEMHSAFRTIGQQMGLQLVRGILPESIDVFINNVIQEKVQQELLASTRTVAQETLDTQAATLGGTNILRTLYHSDRIVLAYPIDGKVSDGNFLFEGFSNDNIDKWSPEQSFAQNGFIEYYNAKNGYYEILIPKKDGIFYPLRQGFDTADGFGYRSPNNKPIVGNIDPMMFLGFSIEYDDTLRGNAVACRMIGADALETTLRDFCNGASKDAPIVSLLTKNVTAEQWTGTNESVIKSQYQEYIQLYTNSKATKVNVINIKYIKKPNVVKYDIDAEKCINCDLPEYCHYEIVERAVQRYKIAIGGQVAEPRNNR